MAVRPLPSEGSVYAVPPHRGKWGHRWDSRPALLDTNETPRYLGFGGMVQAEGIAPP